MAYSTLIRELFELPSQLSGLNALLDPLWENITLDDFIQAIVWPLVPDATEQASPEMSEEDALAELADLLVPVTEPEPAPEPEPVIEVLTVDPAKRVLNLKLKALQDLELKLFDGFTAVLNKGGFEAKATFAEQRVTVECKLKLSGRFDEKLLRPMRKVTVGGEVRYEPDPTMSYVEFDLAEVDIRYDTQDGLKYGGGLQLTTKQPFAIGSTDLVVDTDQAFFDLSGTDKCLAVQWSKESLKQWLRKVSPALVDQSPTPQKNPANPADDVITGRIMLGDGNAVKEIRIDWFMAENRTLALPGVKVQTPQETLFTLMLGGQDRQLDQIALTLTFQNVPGDLEQLEVKKVATPTKVLWAYSTFAWGRDGERELHTAEDADEPKLFDVRLGTNASDTTPKRVSLVLMDLDTGGDHAPTFLKQLATPLKRPDFNDKATLCSSLSFETKPLNDVDWKGKFHLDDSAFRLPFLDQKDDQPQNNQFSQFIEIDKPGLSDIDLVFEKPEIAFALGITLKFGSIRFKSNLDVAFNWERFALKVNHDKGLKMLSDQEELESQEHLGLVWRLKGKKDVEDGKAKFHYFTLVTKDYNYQVQMAQGATFELDYTRASKEPITFIVSDFVLGPKGVDLTAQVSDRPARLNGIDTRFTFHGSSLTIKENKIQDFTLAGSGPLPPDLVGDAMVDIALQFAQREGQLTLVRGKANLQGNKLLDCKNTRFQFSIDAMGLEFVNDGAFHLYFTLTGSAQFVLAPGDDKQGALALLPKIKLDLVECPLCGDPRVIAKHVKFLIEFPKPKSFNFLGAFEFELRAIGFFPSTDIFDDNPPAMEITGQLRFAQGAGDTSDSRPDYHKLFIALPKPGDFFPRLHFKQIAVNLAIGEAFKLQGIVEFKDSETEKGFWGEGSLELQGMPTIAAAFAFVRVRRDEKAPWVRAWFIYLEVRRLSVMIPYVQIYLREVGLGFGYRFTIASIKVADRENDVKKLIASLTELSRTQADLARRDRWEIDLEGAGEDPRWTIVLRALFSQTSASTIIRYNESAEKTLPNTFLFDVMIAFRSDLTFYMAARGWLNTNYYTYDKNAGGKVKENPFVSGFIILVPRRKRFLAHVASNKNAYIGDTPPLPDLVKSALKAARFSATLLIEPGLMHYELGWPNNIGWDFKFGPMAVSITSGFIFRITRADLIMGISYKASGTIDIKAEVDLGFVGVRIRANAYAAWGARLIGKLPFDHPEDTRIYGAIGLEVRIEISFEFFIRIPLIFTTIELSYKLSLEIGFTAGLEAALAPKPADWGIRGTGTLYIMAMGHSLEVSVTLSFNGDKVDAARQIAADVLGMGLEATEVEGVPGVDGGQPVPAGIRTLPAAPRLAVRAFDSEPPRPPFELPEYSVFVIRSAKADEWGYFVLLPKGERKLDATTCVRETGFLPPPPLHLTMQREVWPLLLDRGVASDNLVHALRDTLQDTGLQVAEILPIVLSQQWMLYASNKVIELTQTGNRLVLRSFDYGAASPPQPVKPDKRDAALWALNAGRVKEARNALQAVQLFSEFSDPQQHPDGEFRIVRVFDSRRWYIYYQDKVFQIDRVLPTNWWEWYLEMKLTVRELGLSATGQPIRDLATDDFADSLEQGQTPLTVGDAMHAVEINVEQPLPVTVVDAARRIYTFKIGMDTFRLEPANAEEWTVRVDVAADFRLSLPALTPDEIQPAADFRIEQYQPETEKWVMLIDKQNAPTGSVSSWKVNWDAQLFKDKVKQYDVINEEPLVHKSPPSITLAQYLTYAYMLAPIKDSRNPAIPAQPIPLKDPDLGEMPQPLADDRVHNPTDNSYEAAVRGALEQFAGSPYFKHDPDKVLYDKMLQEAFQDNTTIYTPDGSVPADRSQHQDLYETQQSRQLRGMVIQDIIGDLQAYVEKTQSLKLDDKIPFQMGLVFRYRGGKPFWLDNFAVEGTPKPSIQQRQTPSDNDAGDSLQSKAVDTFNILSTAFDANPPRFQRVQQYTSAATIAIAWDLEWPEPPHTDCSPAQRDPEHHLAHYVVRRRALDDGERDAVYTVKPSHAVHRRTTASDGGPTGMLLLRSRFQVVDHFTYESTAARAALPESGRSYLYTITPMDLAGNAGRPLTLIATRYPDDAPPVPLNGELTATYQLNANDLIPEGADVLPEPPAFPPSRVHIEWDDTPETQANAHVAVRDYRLIFRKDLTLPVGSYGLDSTTQRPPARLLPTSNARPLASDIKITLQDIDSNPATGRRSADILAELIKQGVFPAGNNPTWRPESWRVFFQTVSANGVPSSLVPVELRLRAESSAPAGQTPGIEERAPAEMEWLARPIRFPILPPEDQRAIAGAAHFPMPILGQFTFDGGLTKIGYRQHPAEIRCVRFRWNQGPSNVPGYPLDLNAGYHLLLLDIDAQPDDTFDDEYELDSALRQIQEVRMLPADDLLLQPSDTLRTGQWEAWYPSAIQRQRTDEQMAALRSQNKRGPWYSWRESRLVWPPCPSGYIANDEPFVRTADVHPFLGRLVNRLGEKLNVDDAATQPGYIVALQPPPAIQPNTWATFVENTNPKNDPYGWAVLQRLGLSITFTLRNDQTGDLLKGDDLLEAVKTALDDLAKEDDPGDPLSATLFDTYYRHLFVELLFQPGKSIGLQEHVAEADSLLALIQVSLRPVTEQYLKYHQVVISGPTGGQIEAEFVLKAGQKLDLVNTGDPASGVIELEGTADGKPLKRVFKLPVGGQMVLVFRGEDKPQAVIIRVQLPRAPTIAAVGPLKDNTWLVYEKSTTPDAHYVRIDTTQPRPSPLTPKAEQSIRDLLVASDKSAQNTAAINTLLNLIVKDVQTGTTGEPPTPFIEPTNELSTRFVAPTDRLVSDFASAEGKSAEQWQTFRRYALALNDPDASQKIILSLSKNEIGQMLPGFLDWSQRFFDMGADVHFNRVTGLGATEAQGTVTEPLTWVATAYPRAGAPAYAAPDANGRLQYDHLFEDRWAHNYRFYIRPYGRYDLIWRSFGQSSALFPQGLAQVIKDSRKPARPDPHAGGLDVVLDRTQPIEPPLILSSTRLDKPTIPGQPVPPGKTWEVIIAQHPEQALVERNQTLARHLAFRQVAFTLLRRFTEDGWIAELSEVIRKQSGVQDYIIHTRMVGQATPPDIPASYPLQPDHIDLENLKTVSEDDARSLALPARIGAFQQGALVLQWQGLPFYYTHRLLVIAQTASTVSSINQVEQSNFEYIAPQPAGVLSGLWVNWKFDSPPITQNMPIRQIAIPLRRFWDSLPPEAQAGWPEERPDTPDSIETTHKFSSLPDPEVVYQIVEQFTGNIEVQVEFFYDGTSREFTARQLGKHFFGQVKGLLAPPDTLPATPDGRSVHDDFILLTGVAQVSEEELSKPYSLAPTSPLSGKVSFLGKLLRVVGILTLAEREELTALVDAIDKPTIKALYDDWYSEEPISEDKTAGLPPLLKTIPDHVTFLRGQDVKLVWTGSMTDTEKAALLALPGDQAFKVGLEALAKAVVAQPAPVPPDALTIMPVPHDPEPLPAELTDSALPILQTKRLELQRSDDGKAYTALIWKGMLVDDDIPTFDAVAANWAQTPELRAALDQLRQLLAAQVLTALLADPKPLVQDDLPPDLQEQLILPTVADPLLCWRTSVPVPPSAPTDAQRAQLEALVGYPAFVDAVRALMSQWDQGQSTEPLLPGTQPPAAIPPTFAGIDNRCVWNQQDRILIWGGPLIRDAERTLFNGWIRLLRAFEELQTRLTSHEAQINIQLPPEAVMPAQDEMQALWPALFERGQFIYNTDARGIGWGNSEPNGAELEALRKLTGQFFADALAALLNRMDQDRETPLMPPIVKRPTQDELPEAIRTQLIIAPTSLTWNGRLKNKAQYDALTALAQNSAYDADFLAAAAQIILELTVTPIVVMLKPPIPLRPQQTDLPDVLAAKLLIGRYRLRFHGLMVITEGKALLTLFTNTPADQHAIQRLYATSLKRGMRGRKLLIRARRGNAKPSASIELRTEPLTAGQ